MVQGTRSNFVSMGTFHLQHRTLIDLKNRIDQSIKFAKQLVDETWL